MCRPDRVGIDHEENELQITQGGAIAGRRWQVLRGLGHAVQARSCAVQVREKAEHAIGQRHAAWADYQKVKSASWLLLQRPRRTPAKRGQLQGVRGRKR